MSDYTRTAPQKVLITGATGGFGQAFAHRFDAAGTQLVLQGRSKEKLEALAATLRQTPTLIIHNFIQDENSQSHIETCFDAAKECDLLINNAGGALGADKFQETAEEDLLNVIMLNVTGLVALTRFLLPHMTARQKGHVINIGSTAGNWPYPGGHVYCAAKAFVHQLSLALRGDLTGTNVRVSTIAPGMAETPFSLHRFNGDVEKAAAVYADTKALSAADIAEAVYWTATCPAHMNVNSMEIMPTKQSFGMLTVERNK